MLIVLLNMPTQFHKNNMDEYIQLKKNGTWYVDGKLTRFKKDDELIKDGNLYRTEDGRTITAEIVEIYKGHFRIHQKKP